VGFEGIAAEPPTEVRAIAHDASPRLAGRRIHGTRVGKERILDRAWCKAEPPPPAFGAEPEAQPADEVADLERPRRRAELQHDAVARRPFDEPAETLVRLRLRDCRQRDNAAERLADRYAIRFRVLRLPEYPHASPVGIAGGP